MTEKKFLQELLKTTLDIDNSEREMDRYRKENQKEPPIGTLIGHMGKVGKLYDLSKQYFGI